MTRLYRIFFVLILAACALDAAAQTQQWKLMHQGNRAFRNNKFDDAADYYRAALKTNSKDARAHFNLGDTYLAKGDMKAAMAEYDSVVSLEKNSVVKGMAFHNRGYIYQKQADTNAKEKQQLLRKAIEEYKNALRLRPNDDGTRYNLALCQKQLRDEQNKQNQQQQQQKQQQQQQSKEEQKDQKQDDQKSPQQQQDNKQEQKDPATEQYLNLSRQAEKRALEKIKNGQPVHRGLDKNW